MQDLAGLGPVSAIDHAHELGAAGADETCQPQHLAFVQGERRIAHKVPAAQPAHFQQHRAVRRCMRHGLHLAEIAADNGAHQRSLVELGAGQ